MNIDEKELDAMRARLAERQAKRRFDLETQEAIDMVRRRPFGEAMPEAIFVGVITAPPKEAPMEMIAEAIPAPQKEPAWRGIALAATWCAVEAVRGITAQGWLFALAMAVIAFLAAGIFR